MSSFFGEQSDNNPVPEWASFFDAIEYSAFTRQLNNYFRSVNIEFESSGEGRIYLKENEMGFEKLGLMNVAQNCRHGEIENYGEIISGHFDSLFKTHKFQQEFDKIASDFEEVRKYIGVRLYDNDYVAHVGKENTIGKEFAGNVYGMVVFDFPHSVSSIKPDQILPWNKTVDELFEIGIENVKKNYPVTLSKENLDDFSVWLIHGEHFFAPNIVFDLENRPELTGTHGSLVAIPHRHIALIYPIENLEIVNAINGLIPVTFQMHSEGPGSLSNQIFWYRNGEFTELPYKIDEEQLEFFPPASFTEMLNELQ